LAAACVVLVLHAWRFDFVCDDAFISFRYADNLVRYGELTYNPGERVEGYTNFLWTMAMAGVLRLGGDPVVWSKALGVAFSVATLLALFSFSSWWGAARDPPRSRGWAAVAPLLMAVSSPFAAWSEGGLETALFAFLVTAAALRQVVELVDEDRGPWSAALAALAALARPEGMLLFALLAVHRFAHTLPLRRSPRSSKPLLKWGALFLAIFVPYWLWRWSYYGYPLPNTYYAKSGGPLWGAGWRYLVSFVSDTQAWMALLLLAVPWRASPHAGTLKSLVALIAAAWAVYVAAIGGDFMALYRFLVPVVPLLALAAQEGLASLAERTPPPLRRAVAVTAVLALVGSSAAWNRRLTEQALEIGSRDGIDSIGWLKQFVTQTSAIGRHLASTYPRKTWISTTAAGAIPYYSRLRTIDQLGLSDLYVAHEVPATGDRPGHRRAAPEAYVIRRHPDVLISHPSLSAAPTALSPAEAKTWQDQGYVWRSVLVPGLEPPYWSYLEARR
jgi:arabinofuranosyltransferase